MVTSAVAPLLEQAIPSTPSARVPPQTSRPLELVRQCFAQYRDLVAQMGWTDVIITLPDLITMDDRGCAHVGLESRSPFLDHRIVEFAFRLPGRMKIRAGGLIKWIFREVAREFLPADLVDCRDKMGMVSPLSMWLQRERRGGSQGLIESLQPRKLGLPLQMPEDNAYDRRLHALVSRDLWLRTFHDKRG
jgi:asparagine synthetase B (glutamine-hydrolysing)